MSYWVFNEEQLDKALESFGDTTEAFDQESADQIRSFLRSEIAIKHGLIHTQNTEVNVDDQDHIND